MSLDDPTFFPEAADGHGSKSITPRRTISAWATTEKRRVSPRLRFFLGSLRIHPAVRLHSQIPVALRQPPIDDRRDLSFRLFARL